jgi:hypothetical protein
LKRKATEEVFFKWQGTVHNEFISEEAMVNKVKYKEVLAHL